MRTFHHVITACLALTSLASDAAAALTRRGPVLAASAVPAPKRVSAAHSDQVSLARVINWLPAVSHAGTFPTRELKGIRVGYEYAWYSGCDKNPQCVPKPKGVRPGQKAPPPPPFKVMPAQLTLDWTAQLRSVCDRKFVISRKNSARDMCNSFVAEYRYQDAGRMTIGRYSDIASEQAALVCASLDWNKVGEMYFKKDKVVNGSKTALLKRLCGTINGHMLMAYAITELMPTEGELAYRYLDFLLRNAGRRYVESLPSLHDQLASFGPFQLTSLAVSDKATLEDLGGASKMNRALPRRLRIPASVMLIRGNANFKAATLFALNNLGLLIRALDPRQMAMLERKAQTHPLELTDYIGAAHHNPRAAVASGKQWLNVSATHVTYQERCTHRIRAYAMKTHKNSSFIQFAQKVIKKIGKIL